MAAMRTIILKTISMDFQFTYKADWLYVKSPQFYVQVSDKKLPLQYFDSIKLPRLLKCKMYFKKYHKKLLNTGII